MVAKEVARGIEGFFVKGNRYSSHLCNVEIIYEAHSISYPVTNSGFSPAVKLPGSEAVHSVSSNATVMNEQRD
jgi:hypothetical protein